MQNLNALKQPEVIESKAEQFAKEIENQETEAEFTDDSSSSLLEQYQELQKKVSRDSRIMKRVCCVQSVLSPLLVHFQSTLRHPVSPRNVDTVSCYSTLRISK